jgi:hypothetical protein
MFKQVLRASILLCAPCFAFPALADGFTSVIQDAVGISVQGAAVQTVRMGSSYAVSGVNVTAAGDLGLSGGTDASATAAALPSPAVFSITNAGQEFNLSEKLLVGDAIVTPTVVTSGQVAPVTYGTVTSQVGGNITSGSTPATAAATINTMTQAMTITGGGVGTTVTAGRTVTLTAF